MASDVQQPDLTALAHEFLNDLFGHQELAGRYIALFTLPDMQTTCFADPKDAASQAVTRAVDADVYVRVTVLNAPISEGRGSAGDARALVGLWADVDIANPVHKKAGRLPPDESMARKLLGQAIPLLPSLLVHSGHGLQAWWLFKEPWIFADAADQGKAAELSRRFQQTITATFVAAGYTCDSTFDLARVLRVPGTVNRKSEPVPVRLLERLPHRYTPEDFELYLVAGDAAGEADVDLDDVQLAADAEPPTEQFKALGAAHVRFQPTWEHRRPDLSDQSLSAYDCALASMAARAGWADQHIANLIIAHRRRWGDQGARAKAMRPDYIARTIRKAKSSAKRVSVNRAVSTASPPVQLRFDGPLELVLTAIAARHVGESRKPEVTFEVAIGATPQAPLKITSAGNAIKTAARDLTSWLAAARDVSKVSRPEQVAVHQFVAKVMSAVDGLPEHFRQRRQAQPRPSVAGPTIQSIVIQRAPELAGLTFKNDDKTAWSETLGANVDVYQFEKFLPKELILACEQAIDYPVERIGRSAPISTIKQYLTVAWTETLKHLPREVIAQAGPDSRAAQRYEAAIIRIFGVRELWRKTFARNGSEFALDSATLAQMARDKLEHQDPTKPTGWMRCHNNAVEAWCCHLPVLGAGDQPTGEVPVAWIGVRYELVHQLSRHHHIVLPNTSNLSDLTQIANRYRLSAEGEPAAPSSWVREGGRAMRLLVLSRALCDDILWHFEAGEDPEQAMLRERATPPITVPAQGAAKTALAKRQRGLA